jgi:hypothetical protein
MQFFEAHVQAVTLLVLAFTAGAIVWQAIEAKKQAEASVSLARLSLEQTKLMQMQVHASFRPVVTVTGGEYSPGIATLTLKNVGTGPAIAIFGVYRSQARQSVGSLSANEKTGFVFQNSLNAVPHLTGPLGHGHQPISGPSQDVALWLEYQSASGANCWTTIDFKVSGEGAVEPDNKSGMDLPSLTTNL